MSRSRFAARTVPSTAWPRERQTITRSRGVRNEPFTWREVRYVASRNPRAVRAAVIDPLARALECGRTARARALPAQPGLIGSSAQRPGAVKREPDRAGRSPSRSDRLDRHGGAELAVIAGTPRTR